MARPDAARAHDPQDVLLGGDNSATTTTAITNSANGSAVVSATTITGTALYGITDSGTAAVYGDSNSATAVVGNSYTGTGVHGTSSAGNGVHGNSQSAGASGVYGENTHKGYGVAGRSNVGPFGGAAATLGDNTADGIGVWARSSHGIALLADPVNPDAIALRAQGVAQFTRSGKLTVKAGASSVTRTAIRVDPGTLVLAILQQDRPGVYVRSAVPDAAGNSFTIRLNKSVGSDTKVGWFLVN
jgi:hypothetical protein